MKIYRSKIEEQMAATMDEATRVLQKGHATSAGLTDSVIHRALQKLTPNGAWSAKARSDEAQESNPSVVNKNSANWFNCELLNGLHLPRGLRLRPFQRGRPLPVPDQDPDRATPGRF